MALLCLRVTCRCGTSPTYKKQLACLRELHRSIKASALGGHVFHPKLLSVTCLPTLVARTRQIRCYRKDPFVPRVFDRLSAFGLSVWLLSASGWPVQTDRQDGTQDARRNQSLRLLLFAISKIYMLHAMLTFSYFTNCLTELLFAQLTACTAPARSLARYRGATFVGMFTVRIFLSSLFVLCATNAFSGRYRMRMTHFSPPEQERRK